MATYTAVLVTAPELSQDDVVEALAGVGIVAFCGPGSLVQGVPDDPDVGPRDESERTLEALDGFRE